LIQPKIGNLISEAARSSKVETSVDLEFSLVDFDLSKL